MAAKGSKQMRNSTISTSLILGLVVLSSAPARADWQYTKWEMTANEIVAASKGKARSLPSEDRAGKSTTFNDAIAIGEFETGPFVFDVMFGARKGEVTLDAVILTLKNPTDYRRLRETLNAKYGEGREETSDDAQVPVTRTFWESDDDSIQLEHVEVPILDAEYVFLKYSQNLKNLDL